MKKLKRSEFFNIYGVSLLLGKVDDNELLTFLLPIAKKYYNITSHAIRSELRHFKNGGWDHYSEYAKQKNLNILKKYKINNWTIERKEISLEICQKLFLEGCWEQSYGGVNWANICKQCIKLESEIKQMNLKNLTVSIDMLNQLEHNTSLYLARFCYFDLEECLDIKFNITPDDIFSKCSEEIVNLYIKSKRLICRFH